MQKSPQFFNQSEQALRHYSNKILILNLKNANEMNECTVSLFLWSNGFDTQT